MLKLYDTDHIRNVVILGHGSTGKSTLFDAILCSGGKIDKIGNHSDGLTSDFEEEEKSRKMSIKSALGFIETDDVKINIIDTPGMVDFIGEARAAIQAVETAILIVDAADGVQIETEKAWRYLKEKNIPTIIFVNKMDKERANFDNAFENIKSSLKANAFKLSFGIGAADKFAGVVDIMQQKAYLPKGDGKTENLTNIDDITKAEAEEMRLKAVEISAEGDDALTEKFLEGGQLSEEEIHKGLTELMSEAKIVPVFCGASAKGIGIKSLIEFIKKYAPAPSLGKEYKGYDPDHKEREVVVQSKPDKSFACVVWKTQIDQYSGRFNYLKVISGELSPETELYNSTKKIKERATKLFTMIGNKQVDVPKISCGDIGIIVKLEKTSTRDTLCDPKHAVVLPIIDIPHPVYSYAIESGKKGEEDKIGQIFGRITDENTTVTYQFNAETKQTVLSGMGEMQLDIILKSIAEKYKLDIKTSVPRVAYRETITKKAESQYKHKKQSGGHGQYGEVYLRVAPKPRGGGYEFVDSIVGGVIPKNYIPGVEKGIVEGLEKGVLGKFPVVDIWVELHFGSYHSVDSSELSFKIAGMNAVKKAMEAAGPQLLEPVMEVDVFVEKAYMGDVINDITSRRGKILGMGGDENNNGVSDVKAQIPLAEMQRYTIDLRSMTSGKATFEMKFSHYEPIGGKIAEKVIEERMKQLEDEASKG